MLFAKATKDQVKLIKGILDLFCRSSGQKISHNKPSIFFSKNVSLSRHGRLSELFGFHLTNSLGKYLDVPLIHDRCKNLDFQYIIDRMNHRLNGWKNKFLSLARRVTLAKVALATIPSYVVLPVKLLLRYKIIHVSLSNSLSF